VHDPHGKAAQLERDFGIPRPVTLLRGGLRRRDDRDIEPYTASVARDRLIEIAGRGHTEDEALIVLMMRGARLEVLAKALDTEAEGLRGRIKAALTKVTLGSLYGEAQRGLDLARRA